MENLLTVYQALGQCLGYLENKDPASMGETGKCSSKRAVTWEMQEMAEVVQKGAGERGMGGDI